MSNVIYAIGDIHGRDDLLAELHESITSYHGLMHSKQSATIVHIGDYIDGGPDSKLVIDRLMKGLHGFEFVNLLGNHEDLLLACTRSDDRQVWWNWLSNGGEATLASFDVSFRFGGYDSNVLLEAIGADRIRWLRALPLTYQTGDFLFVHAGIAPNVTLKDQCRKDLLWIRGRFLESDVDHGYRVIHGHTPEDEPVIRPNRIGIDTGATSNGMLTAVVLQGGGRPRFLKACGAPTRRVT